MKFPKTWLRFSLGLVVLGVDRIPRASACPGPVGGRDCWARPFPAFNQAGGFLLQGPPAERDWPALPSATTSCSSPEAGA